MIMLMEDEHSKTWSVKRRVTYGITSNGVLDGGSNDRLAGSGAKGVCQNAIARLDRLSSFSGCHTTTRGLGGRGNDTVGDIRGRCNGADSGRQVNDLGDGADSGGITGGAVGNVLGTANNGVGGSDLDGQSGQVNGGRRLVEATAVLEVLCVAVAAGSCYGGEESDGDGGEMHLECGGLS